MLVPERLSRVSTWCVYENKVDYVVPGVQAVSSMIAFVFIAVNCIFLSKAL